MPCLSLFVPEPDMLEKHGQGSDYNEQRKSVSCGAYEERERRVCENDLPNREDRLRNQGEQAAQKEAVQDSLKSFHICFSLSPYVTRMDASAGSQSAQAMACM